MTKKTVVITGVSRGLGKELALEFSKNGWNVAGCYKTNMPEYEIPNSKFFQTDISKPDAVSFFIKEAVCAFGKIDCLINNAAIGKNKIIFKEDFNNWNEVIQTNLNGAFYVIKETLDAMAKQKDGIIINISSISAYKSYLGAASYSASKAALIALTKTAAREGGRFNARVNAVLPGFHNTRLGESAGDKYIAGIKAESVLNATTDLSDFLKFMIYLANTKTISGQIFNIDSRII
ncbi:MAG: SDR family oxidoreductase [Endomicrobium sp.]|jgi:3-oxoacyl-[acyl-carrier protein] reductase|nr:SDR family oxidoreductase [Endomicrobium sp.]